MTIAEDIQSLSPSAIIELFEIDVTPRGGTKQYFHAGTNGLFGSVLWKGIAYAALPIEVEGFEMTIKGTLPRPKIRVANVGGLFSADVATYDDLVGCKLTRRRTFAKYLDAGNFAGGNPTADSTQAFPDDIWFVEQKISENKYQVEWELSSAFDLMGVMLPRRQIIQGACSATYRRWNATTGAFDYTATEECGYTGSAYFTKTDAQTADPTQDFCSKHLESCERRHPTGSVPFGGFPGAVRLQ